MSRRGGDQTKDAIGFDMVKASIRILITRGYQIAIGALVAALLARTLGASSYGDFIYVTAVISIFSVPIQFGLFSVVSRITAGLRRDPDAVRVFHSWSFRLVLTYSAVGVVLLTAVLLALHNPPERDYLNFVPLAVAAFVAINFSFLQSGILTGWLETEKEQLLQNMLRPTVFLTGVVLLILLVHPFSAQHALVAYFLSIIAVVVGLWLALAGRWKCRLLERPTSAKRREWTRATLYFMAIGGIDVLLQSTDILMLGAVATSEDVAVYRIGAVLAALLSLPLSAANAHASPRIAAAKRSKNVSEIRYQSIRLAKASLAATLALTIFAWAFAFPAIKFVFGEGFSGSFDILLILGLSSVFNVAMGLNRAFLSMLGHEATVFRAMGTTAILNIFLNIILISWLDAIGAAIATAVATVLWNVWLHIECRRSLGFTVTAFSDRSRPKRT